LESAPSSSTARTSPPPLTMDCLSAEYLARGIAEEFRNSRRRQRAQVTLVTRTDHEPLASPQAIVPEERRLLFLHRGDELVVFADARVELVRIDGHLIIAGGESIQW